LDHDVCTPGQIPFVLVIFFPCLIQYLNLSKPESKLKHVISHIISKARPLDSYAATDQGVVLGSLKTLRESSRLRELACAAARTILHQRGGAARSSLHHPSRVQPQASAMYLLLPCTSALWPQSCSANVGDGRGRFVVHVRDRASSSCRCDDGESGPGNDRQRQLAGECGGDTNK
jgi:hypothetical protein